MADPIITPVVPASPAAPTGTTPPSSQPPVDSGKYTFSGGKNAYGQSYAEIFPNSGANPNIQPTTPTPAAPTPAAPFDRGPAPAPVDTPKAPDLNSMIETGRQQSQAQIDAISREMDAQIASDTKAGQVNAQRTRALSANAGLGGSDFASANAADTESKTAKVLASDQAIKSAKIAAILSGSDQRQTQLYETQRTQYRQDAETTLANKAKIVAAAKDDIKALGATGITPDKLKTSDPQLYQQLQDQTGLKPLELDAYLIAAHPGIDSKNIRTTKIGDNLVMSYVDPTTKQIVNSTYNVPGSAAYDGFTVAPDGTALFYSKKSGQATIAPNTTEGQFGKPEPVKTVNPGKYGALQYDTKTSSWVPIAGPSSKPSDPGATPPLFTKTSYARLSAAGVDSTMANKLAAAILSGASLDTIRKALQTDKNDPTLLDKFDRAVGIAKLLQTHKAASGAAATPIPGITPGT